MTPKAARYNRVNLDGKSINRTAISAVAMLAGTVVCLDDNEQAIVATAALAQAGKHLYVVTQQHLGITEEIAAGDSLNLDYVQTGREFAVRVKAATALNLDSQVAVGAGGVCELAGEETGFIAYSVEKFTVAADKVELVRVRIA